MSQRIDEASKERKLWFSMQSDLSKFFPHAPDQDVLMCPMCGRFLPFGNFSLEHIIPQQALGDDPKEVKALATTNERSGNILLCSKPLRIRDGVFHPNGCNGWKGKFYDKQLREVLNGRAMGASTRVPTSERHIIALLVAAFLGMIREYGYQIALTPSGILLREQFFSPNSFRKNMPVTSQMILGADMPAFADQHLHLWSNPIRFDIKDQKCFVVIRTLSLILPLSRDPRVPIAVRLPIVPAKYKLRPNFHVFVP